MGEREGGGEAKLHEEKGGAESFCALTAPAPTFHRLWQDVEGNLLSLTH